MGMRFRKSISYGPMRVNFSKSGIGGSIGGKGCRLTKTANGRTRSTLSVPGTGLSYVSEHDKSNSRSRDNVSAEEVKKIGEGMTYPLCKFVWLPMILLGSLLSLVSWSGIVFIGIGVGEFAYVHSRRKKEKETNGND